MNLADIDIRLLRIFDAVVRNGGFVGAQLELNISNSTISNHLSSLEERLGIKLCFRGRAGFRLTDKGTTVHEAATRLFKSLDDFVAESNSVRGRLVGSLRIGVLDCINTDENYQLDTAIRNFRKRDNDVHFHIHQENPQSLQHKLLNEELDLGIGSFPHQSSGLSFTELYRERHSLYCSSDHPLSKTSEKDLSPEALARHSVVTRGYWVEQDQKLLGLIQDVATAYHIEPQLMLILSGEFIGFLPDHYADQWVKSGRVKKILSSKMNYIIDFAVVTRKNQRKTLVIETFTNDLLKAHSS